MLNSIKSAVYVKGRKNTAIARDVERSTHTVNQWFCGAIPIPIRARSGLETAIGAPIDWDAYSAEFAALDAPRAAKRAEKKALPPPAPPAPPPATIEKPAEAPKSPAEAPRRLTATPPPKKPAMRPEAPAKAPAAMPPARKGFFATLLADDGKGLFNE